MYFSASAARAHVFSVSEHPIYIGVVVSHQLFKKKLESVVAQRCWSPRKIRKPIMKPNSAGKYYVFPPNTHETKKALKSNESMFKLN